jgi:6-phosphogluconolactonase (cycloisomerase 2 family)
MLHFLVLPLLAASGLAANVYVTHYAGTLTTLKLCNKNGVFSLNQTQEITVGGLPSWTTWNSASRTLYFTNEADPGVLTVYRADEAGQLTAIANATAFNGGVSTVLYGGSDGKGYIATAH